MKSNIISPATHARVLTRNKSRPSLGLVKAIPISIPITAIINVWWIVEQIPKKKNAQYKYRIWCGA